MSCTTATNLKTNLGDGCVDSYSSNLKNYVASVQADCFYSCRVKIVQNNRDTLNPFIKKEGKKLMKYYDDQGNELNIRTELDDMLDELYDKLDKMTPEERMAWYSRGMYVKPLKYTQDIDNTIYIVRTNFNENTDSTVYDAVERITSKDI